MNLTQSRQGAKANPMGFEKPVRAVGRWHSYPAYKPSGVEWFGDIPAHWELQRMKFASRINPPKSEVAHLPRDTAVSFLPMEKIGEDGSLSLDTERTIEQVGQGFTYFRDGDVIVAKITPCFENGKGALCAGLQNSIGFGTTELHVIRPDDRLDSKYLFYVTRTHLFRNLGVALMYGAAGQQRVPQSFIDNFPVAIPGLEEQRAIAAFLDRETTRLDALIAKKQRLIELLQEKHTALISQAVTKGLDPNVTMKDSGVEWLGEIPAHWTVEKLKRLSPRISGRLVYQPAQYFVDEGVPFLFGNNVTESGFVLDNLKYISPEVNERFSVHALRAGDLVTVRVGDPGVTAVVPPELEGLNCASLMIIRRSSTFVSEWLAYAMNSHIGDYQVDAVQYGAAQEQINITDAVNFVFPVPPLHEQAQIAEYLSHAASRIDALKRKINDAIERLREYRTALISAAVTGKIDVRPSP